MAIANRDVNKVLGEDTPIHDWYRFVLSFPPHLVREYCERFAVTSRERVLDLFCGTGTVLVECKKLGITSIDKKSNNQTKSNRYDQIIERLFFNHYLESTSEVVFERAEMEDIASKLEIKLPQNIKLVEPSELTAAEIRAYDSTPE